MTGALNWIEETCYNGAMAVSGDPVLLGLVLFGFFVVFVYLQGTRFDGKLLIIVPAFFLAMAFIPVIYLLLLLVVGGIFWFALSKMWNR